MTTTKITGFVALVAFVTLGAGLGVQSARAGATVLKDIPIGGTQDATDCCGEQVGLTGVAHVVLPPSGGVRLKISDVAGVGMDTGDDYVGVGVSTQIITNHVSENGATNSTFTFHLRMRSDNCEFLARGNAHITTNANGDVTSDFEFDSVTCK